MKNLTLITLFIISTISLIGQSDIDIPSRKGKVAIETGASLLGGIIGGGSGVGVLAGFEGDTFVNFQFDGGFFVSERFVIKANVGLIAADDALAIIGTGVKYYFGDRIPVQILGTVITGDGSVFSGYGSIGYAARLAPNINLEPSLGVRVFGGAGILDLSTKFVMFF